MGKALLGRSDTEATIRWMEGNAWERAWGEVMAKERDGSYERVDGRKPWEMGNIAWGEGSGGKERYGSDDRVGGGETVGNRLGRAPVERSDTGVTRARVDGRGTVRNSLGRAPVGRSDTGVTTGWLEGKRWCDEREETVGNSLGRAPVGRSDTGVTTGWMEGKPWEIAWRELRWESAIYTSDDRVDGREAI